MYLRGLQGAMRGLGQEDDSGWGDWGYSGPEPTPTGTVSLPTTSDTGPAASVDWTGLVKSALITYGDISKSEAQVKVAQAQAQPMYRYLTAPTQRPVYSPFTGAASGAGGIALAVAVIGGLAWFAFK